MTNKNIVFPEVLIKVMSTGKDIVYTFSQTTIYDISAGGNPDGDFWDIKFRCENFVFKLDAMAGISK